MQEKQILAYNQLLNKFKRIRGRRRSCFIVMCYSSGQLSDWLNGFTKIVNCTIL